MQGGGATFWQAKNGGFWGPGGRADARAQDPFSFTFLVIEKDNRRRVYKASEIILRIIRQDSVLRTHRSSKEIIVCSYRHSELAERTESCY